MPSARRPRGCLTQLLLLGVLCAVLYMVVMAATNPWIYTVGGHLRMWPSWSGAGQLEGPGGIYRLYVSFQPSVHGSHLLPSTSVRGTGWICGPADHSYEVKVGGGTNSVVWRDMNGQPFTLYTWSRGTWSSQPLPPKLNLTGRWQGPDLVMEDKGSAAAAFLPDGSLNPRPVRTNLVSRITLREASWWFGDPCTGGAR